jgi:hypothetical protein
MGMRSSSEGKQASGAGETPTQEANVAEVSYGKPVIGEPEYPDKPSTTRWRAIWGGSHLTRPINRCSNGVVGSQSGGERDDALQTITPERKLGREEPLRPLISKDRLLGPVRRSEG